MRMAKFTFQNWCEKPEFFVDFGHLCIVASRKHSVRDHGCVVHHGASAFGNSLASQQHSTHITVIDDRVIWLQRVRAEGNCNRYFIRAFGTSHRPHGSTLCSIRQRPLIGQFGCPKSLKCRSNTCSVHEGKHLHHISPRELSRDTLDEVLCSQHQ